MESSASAPAAPAAAETHGFWRSVGNALRGESMLAVVGMLAFRRGRWKERRV